MKSFVMLMSIVVLHGNFMWAQKTGACCTIIDMAKEQGTFTIRDSYSGRIHVFKPDVLEGAELKIGDTVEASFRDMKVISIKGNRKMYSLMNVPLTDSCCVVTKMDTVVTDSAVTIIAKNKLTNEDIRFHVPLSFAANVHEGNTVFTNPSHGYAMLLTNTDSTRKALFGFPLLEDTTGKENQLRNIITTPNTKKPAAE